MPDSKELKIDRFIGLSLSGGKNDKTSLCYLDYYRAPHKLFLKTVIDKIPERENESPDDILLEYLNKKDLNLRYIGVDVPITLPHCFLHPCKGVRQCDSATTQWHWKNYKKLKDKNKNHKLFTPYTERCVDSYVTYHLEEHFPISHALGSNSAPLAARAHFLKNRIKYEMIEVYPRLSFWRMGLKLKMNKNQLRFYKHSARGDQVREGFLRELINQNIIFIYDQDIQKLLSKMSTFDAFMSALTAFLYFKDQCEKPPKNFPASEGWIQFPQKEFSW